MTSIRCQCPACQTRVRVSSDLAGSKARCPSCQTVFLIPTASRSDTDQASEAVRATNDSPEPDAKPTLPTAIPLTAEERTALGISIPEREAAWVPPTNDAPSPVIATREASLARVRQKKKSPNRWIVGGFFAVVLCVVALLLFTLVLVQQGRQKAHLILEIPVELRDACVVRLDGETLPLTLDAEIEWEVAPGRHTLTVRRLDHAPYQQELELQAGLVVRLQPTWTKLEPESDREDASDGQAPPEGSAESSADAASSEIARDASG